MQVQLLQNANILGAKVIVLIKIHML